MPTLAVRNQSRGGAPVVHARACETFLCRLRGLTFRRQLPSGEGLLLVERDESRLSTAIHMWGVFMSLGVAWLDSNGVVVDMRVARPWRLYWPTQPAKYVLEGPPSMLESLAVGEQLAFDDAP